MLRFPRNRQSELRVPQFREEESTFAEARVNGGMITILDPADIENRQFVDVKNCHILHDKTGRRKGSTIYPAVKPDSTKVLLIGSYQRFDGTVSIVRATPTTVHLGSASSWSAVAGTLTGGANDRFNYTIVNDRFFFTNNGVDYIQELNPTALTFGRLGNADKYKFITAFNNRLVAAHLVGASPSPISVAWSGNLNFSEWNSVTDISAGSVTLIDNASDYADPISGIFGFTEIALLLRERSLWGISKQPIATQPFNFYSITPGIGCDSPYTAVNIRNGIAWYDFRTKSAYVYTVGMAQPEIISHPIEDTISSQVTSEDRLFASYNPIADEYTICIESAITTLVTAWVYNFPTKTWRYDEYNNLSTLANIDYSSGTLTIEDLSGTIEELSGTIDDLTNTVKTPTEFYGKTTGEIYYHDPAVSTDDSVAYDTRLISKTFVIPRYIGYVTALRLEYEVFAVGAFTLYYSKDSGVTWTSYKTVTLTNDDVGKRKLITCRKNLRCAQYSWKLESSSGLFDILAFEVFVIDSRAEARTR